ncbi:MAG: L,D-transpeptidase family protein [Deltaproteobacteria bacterium]|jgi:murein L,D-transpeptidase YafK|nr:L,D-transpeptidase family protein [Deltaproteobacteria bacterium]
MAKTIKTFFLFLPIWMALFLPSSARAAGMTGGGWQAVVADYPHSPAFLLAVDKKEQLLSVFERGSPLAKVAEYFCTTGQNEGDKLVEGDMKTPEGIYFVVSHIKSGLDYALYGNEAYPLNYPNPVDRLRRKTGYGIWIHGKGVPLVPFDSNGCVGMQNRDLATFVPRHLIGHPVALALNVLHDREISSEKKALAQDLAARVEDWARAWSERSPRLFDFYDPDAYSLAQGHKFSRFKAQKEHLFKTLPWIETTVRDIRVLEGPGYWITWFNQDYRSPGIRSAGTRRLYWQPDASGRLRIVGMEWVKDLRSPLLYADEGYKTPVSGVMQASAPPPPSAPALADIPAAATAKAPVQAMNAAAPPSAPDPSPTPSAPPAGQNVPLIRRDEADRQTTQEALEFVKHWQAAWLGQDLQAYMACYAENAVQDRRRGAGEIAGHKRALWGKTRVLKADLQDIRIDPTSRGLKAVMRQEYADSSGYADVGTKTLRLEFDQNWRIVREEWRPMR